jgi:putative transposase
MTKVRTDKRVRRGREGWQALLAGFEGSGLSAQAFCRRERISSASFYRWRTVLGTGGERRRAVVVRGAAPAFVDAGPLELPRSRPLLSGRLDLRLDLGDGLVLHLVRS